MGQKGAWPRPRDLLFKCWDPLMSLERLKVQSSNLARRLIVRDTNPKNEKWVKRGRGLGHVTFFSNFGIPLMSLERLKVQSSNLASRLIVRDNNPKNEKWVKRGRGLGHVNYFSNFGIPPNISGTSESLKLKFSRQIYRKGY